VRHTSPQLPSKRRLARGEATFATRRQAHDATRRGQALSSRLFSRRRCFTLSKSGAARRARFRDGPRLSRGTGSGWLLLRVSLLRVSCVAGLLLRSPGNGGEPYLALPVKLRRVELRCRCRSSAAQQHRQHSAAVQAPGRQRAAIPHPQSSPARKISSTLRQRDARRTKHAPREELLQAPKQEGRCAAVSVGLASARGG
jgi:hypothetical protein